MSSYVLRPPEKSHVRFKESVDLSFGGKEESYKMRASARSRSVQPQIWCNV